MASLVALYLTLLGQALALSAVNEDGSNHSKPANSASTVVTESTTAAAIPSPTSSGSNADCAQWYEVEPGQDCGTIETKFAISLHDFRFLNPDVREDCTNLQANVYYCVEAVGSMSTYQGYGANTSDTQEFIPMNCTPSTWRSLFDNYTGPDHIVPVADGTRCDCYQYIVFPSFHYDRNKATDCWGTALTWGISPADLVRWNPSLHQNYSVSSAVSVTATAKSDYMYPCTLSSSMSYCVLLTSPTPAASTKTTAPSPRASDEASNCTAWGYVHDFNDCADLRALYDLTLAELYLLNPSVGPDCAGLEVGTYYCVSWFPDGHNSDDWGYQYIDTAVATATSTSTGAGVSTPSPVQTGITSSCSKFYFVQQGDSCYNIAQDNSISMDGFYAWNLAVKECSDLEEGYYVCVGVAASSTTNLATATTTTTTTAPNTGMAIADNAQVVMTAPTPW